VTDDFSGLLREFMLDARERLARAESGLLELPNAPPGRHAGVLADVRRDLHTIKGNAGMMGVTEVQQAAHQAEDAVARITGDAPEVGDSLAAVDHVRTCLAQADEGGIPAQDGHVAPAVAEAVPGGVRVAFQDLDSLVDQLAEMVIFKNRLADCVARGRAAPVLAHAWDDVEAARVALDKSLDGLQERVTRLRMVPLGTLYPHLRRLSHDEASRQGKRVRFETHGGETALDKALLEVASEALGHLVRNAVVHGIESPAERRAVGKPAEGRVSILAKARADEVRIEVVDDGAGIDSEQVQAAATGLALSVRPGADPLSMLFEPGLSTRPSADMSSGRGMGLSSVREAVQRVGGRVEIESRRGAGCRFTIHLPLTVSITRAMLVVADAETYALPLSAMVESLRWTAGGLRQLNDAAVMKWRGKVLPVLDLGRLMGTAQGSRTGGYVLVLEAEGTHRGLTVQDLVGIREIVVKGLDPVVGNPVGVAGSTILGDGRVVLILDPRGLVSAPPWHHAPWQTGTPHSSVELS
jgi:two-component system chemotaxis sensor kinase CheA